MTEANLPSPLAGLTPGLSRRGRMPHPPEARPPWWQDSPVNIRDLAAKLPGQAKALSGWEYVNDPIGGGTALLTAAVLDGDLPVEHAISAACRLEWPRAAHRSHRAMEDVTDELAQAVMAVHRAAATSAEWGELLSLAEFTGKAAEYLTECLAASREAEDVMALAARTLLAAARCAPDHASPSIAVVAKYLRRPNKWGLELAAEQILTNPAEFYGMPESLYNAVRAD